MTTMDTTQATVTRNTTFGMDEMEVDQTNKNRAEAEISRNKDALTPPEDRKFIDNAAEDEDMDQLSASVSVVEISDSEWHRDPNFRKRRVTHRSEEALPPELRGGLDPYARKGLNVAPITSLQEQMDQMKRRQKNAKVEDWVLVEQDLSSIDLPPERPPSEPDLTVETIDNVTDLAEPAFSTEDINLEIKDFNVASKFESISTQTASPWIDAVALRSLEGSKAQPASSTAAMTRFELYAKYIETFSRAETNGENAVDEDQDFKQVTLLFDRLSLSGIRIESLEPFRQKIKEHLQAFWNAAKGLKFSEQPGDVAENRPKSVIDNMEETAPSWQERFISRNSAPLGTVSQQVLDLESMAPVFLPQKSRKVTSDQKQQVAMLKKFGGACADCRRQKKKVFLSVEF